MNGAKFDEQAWRESLRQRRKRLSDFDSKIAGLNFAEQRIWKDFVWGLFAHLAVAVAILCGAGILFGLWFSTRSK